MILLKHNLNKEYFKNIDTEEKAYWLGFIAADGCVYKMSKNAHRLQINLSYKDILQDDVGSNILLSRAKEK